MSVQMIVIITYWDLGAHYSYNYFMDTYYWHAYCMYAYFIDTYYTPAYNFHAYYVQ